MRPFRDSNAVGSKYCIGRGSTKVVNRASHGGCGWRQLAARLSSGSPSQTWLALAPLIFIPQVNNELIIMTSRYVSTYSNCSSAEVFMPIIPSSEAKIGQPSPLLS